MKTITELNNKILYRLVKIIYFLILLVVIIVTTKIIYERSLFYPYNETKTAITCINNKYERFDINKSKYDISGNLTTEQKHKIAKEVCGIESDTIMEFYDPSKESNSLFLTDNNIFKASRGVMEEKIRILYFIGLLAIVLSSSVFITEILRRIIYYIFLGNFYPRK